MHPALILSEHRVTWCCEVLPLSSTWMAESWAEGRRKRESFWSCLPALPSEPSQRLCGAFGSCPILSPMCLTFHDISPSFFLGLSSRLRGHPELLLSFQAPLEGNAVLPPLSCMLSWRLEAPSMPCGQSQWYSPLHLLFPGRFVSPAGQGPPSSSLDEEMSPRATSMPGLRVTHGAWGFALPSRDPGTVDRRGPEGTGAQGERPAVEEPPCLKQGYWPAAPVVTVGDL